LKENPARKAGDRFTKDSYRRAINRACEKAGVPKWTPYQLRYNAATAVREALGVEAAQALLGHSHATMEDWGKLIGDVPSASAILDRFLQSAEIMKITGRSYRLKNTDKSSKGAKAPTGSPAEETK
jgi:IstB-like ATP binding protein